MHKEPLFILFVCFVLGIFFQDYFLLSDVSIYILLISSALSVSLVAVKNFYFYKIRPVLFGFLAFTIGIFMHFHHSQKPELPVLKSKETITFKIIKKLNSNEKNRRYEIDAWKDEAHFKSVLSFPKTEKDLDFKHYYKGEVYINQIEKPYNDFQFDYGKYLSRKGIYFQSYLPNSFKFAQREDLLFAEKIKQRRLETLAKIDQTAIKKRSREFAKGIILADRTEMDQETVRDFRDSGTMHILAISGTHMAIIFGVILLILNFIFPPKYRRPKILLALILIWSFAIFIDFGNSVVRSCVMISVYYTFILLQRKTDLLHSMALAGFVILLLNSNQLFEVGFQLSFAAVFGIYWFNQPILKYLPKARNKFQNFMLNILSISLSAQLGTVPLVIYYFHQYSAVSIVANLVIIPFAEIVIVFSLLMVILISLSIDFSWLNSMYDELITFTLKGIHFFGDADSLMHRMIPLTLLEVLLLYLLFYFLRFSIQKLTIKNVSMVIYFALVFVSLRAMLNYKAEKSDEVLVHQFFKEKVISVKERNSVVFYSSENADQEKIKQYIIEPYLTSRRTKNYSVVFIPRNISSAEFQKQKHEVARQ
ncbi:ComE operon protein 3 [Chryseobacterium salivictor]|uniref:ComE operon protein 3 n=1 Tax=Chryseobacterium salivictor TaxID=2547600 RepID=A0A4P6ZES7_9FLAO|nr:ComE operon protein 3 [Chryseobacterium salivictor]